MHGAGEYVRVQPRGMRYVWGATTLNVAALMLVDPDGWGTCWVNEQCSNGQAASLVQTWARWQVHCGWTFGAVTVDQLQVALARYL